MLRMKVRFVTDLVGDNSKILKITPATNKGIRDAFQDIFYVLSKCGTQFVRL